MADWSGTATAYERSFARLCAGTAGVMADAVGAPDAHVPALDVGTGTGTVAAELAARGWTVIAVDADASMARLAAKRHPELEVVTAALPALPLADGAVAATTANFVVNHVPDPRAAVTELARVTRTGGTVAVSVWPAEPVSPMNALWNAAIARARVTAPPSPRLLAELDFPRTAEGLAALLGSAGHSAAGHSAAGRGEEGDGGRIRPTLSRIRVDEHRWTFVIAPLDLWAAAEGGIATIGRTWSALDADGHERLRSAFLDLAFARVDGDGMLRLPSVALIGTGVVAADVDPHPRTSAARTRFGA